jgi:hypothetical protein
MPTTPDSPSALAATYTEEYAKMLAQASTLINAVRLVPQPWGDAPSRSFVAALRDLNGRLNDAICYADDVAGPVDRDD